MCQYRARTPWSAAPVNRHRVEGWTHDYRGQMAGRDPATPHFTCSAQASSPTSEQLIGPGSGRLSAMPRETKAMSQLTPTDIGRDVAYTAQFLAPKAGFTASGIREVARHLADRTELVIGIASVIVPAPHRDEETIIYDPAFRGWTLRMGKRGDQRRAKQRAKHLAESQHGRRRPSWRPEPCVDDAPNPCARSTARRHGPARLRLESIRSS
jgi:hypothetical protein